MDNMTDQVQDVQNQTAPTNAQDQTTDSTNLEDYKSQFDSLNERYKNLEKDYTRATQEASEYKRNLNSGTNQSSTPSYNPPPVSSTNTVNNTQVDEATRLLLSTGKFASPQDAEAVARRIASEEANKSLGDYRMQIDVDNFVQGHNSRYGNAKDCQLSASEKDQVMDLYKNRGVGLDSALWAIKGKALAKQMALEEMKTSPKTVNTSQSQLHTPFETNVKIKNEDITKDKFEDNFDKVWDAT